MRNKIYNTIDNGTTYSIVMIVTIIVSMIPLLFKESTKLFDIIDIVTAIIFIIDYILRLITADLKLKQGKKSFIKYPFTFMAIIDLISILPSITILNSGFRLLKILRMLRTFRVFRVFKTFRYSKNIQLIAAVFRKQKDSLTVVGTLAVGYIFVSALIIFNVEPDTFNSFFDAIYWATVSLTTVGYGDLYATSVIGKIITMISSVFGIAIVSLPAGIITAGYMEEINKDK